MADSDVKKRLLDQEAATLSTTGEVGTDLRISSADRQVLRRLAARGAIRVYLGEGQLTDDPLDTFGGFGVIEIPDFQGLLKHICENGYEHDVAMNRSQVAAAVNEALAKNMGWEVYYHMPTG